MSGSFLAMVNYISSNPINIGVGSFEVFKVFAMGVVGGFGGYVGKALVQKVKVDTAGVSTVNIALEVGAVAEQVTVEADTLTINADSGTISQTITERQLRDLPLNNRSVLDLAVTMPNVSGDSGSEDIDAGVITPSPGFNLSVNGGRPGSTDRSRHGTRHPRNRVHPPPSPHQTRRRHRLRRRHPRGWRRRGPRLPSGNQER